MMITLTVNIPLTSTLFPTMIDHDVNPKPNLSNGANHNCSPGSTSMSDPQLAPKETARAQRQTQELVRVRREAAQSRYAVEAVEAAKAREIAEVVQAAQAAEAREVAKPVEAAEVHVGLRSCC